MRSTVLVATLAACTHGSTASRGGTGPGDEIEMHSTFVADDEPAPTYEAAAVQKALIAERAAEAHGERELGDAEASGDTDRLLTARADLAVRRRFISMLEVC